MSTRSIVLFFALPLMALPALAQTQPAQRTPLLKGSVQYDEVPLYRNMREHVDRLEENLGKQPEAVREAVQDELAEVDDAVEAFIDAHQAYAEARDEFFASTDPDERKQLKEEASEKLKQAQAKYDEYVEKRTQYSQALSAAVRENALNKQKQEKDPPQQPTNGERQGQAQGQPDEPAWKPAVRKVLHDIDDNLAPAAKQLQYIDAFVARWDQRMKQDLSQDVQNIPLTMLGSKVKSVGVALKLMGKAGALEALQKDMERMNDPTMTPREQAERAADLFYDLMEVKSGVGGKPKGNTGAAAPEGGSPRSGDVGGSAPRSGDMGGTTGSPTRGSPAAGPAGSPTRGGDMGPFGGTRPGGGDTPGTPGPTRSGDTGTGGPTRSGGDNVDNGPLPRDSDTGGSSGSPGRDTGPVGATPPFTRGSTPPAQRSDIPGDTGTTQPGDTGAGGSSRDGGGSGGGDPPARGGNDEGDNSWYGDSTTPYPDIRGGVVKLGPSRTRTYPGSEVPGPNARPTPKLPQQPQATVADKQAYAQGANAGGQAYQRGTADASGMWDQDALDEFWVNNNPNNMQPRKYHRTLRMEINNFNRGGQGAPGQSVRDIDLTNKTPQQIHNEMRRRGAIHMREELVMRDANGNRVRVPHDLYIFDDGGMVRVKPEGVPGDRFRPEPHAVKSVLFDNARDERGVPRDYSFHNEAFKVTNDGKAIPAATTPAKAARKPAGPGAFIEGFYDQLMSIAHTNLPAPN